MIKNNICNNCNKIGHLFHNCKLPITSYGVILIRIKDKKIEYLMIRRKDTFGYIDFIRGKYSPYNFYQIQNIINEMSTVEKNRILNNTFNDLWKMMWGQTTNSQYRNEEIVSCKKFDLLNNGNLTNEDDNNSKINVAYFVNKSVTSWQETEWEFPKGRKNLQENDLECAVREFEEETGLSKHNYKVLENVLPFEETFIGTNYKAYKHKYYLAFLTEDCNLSNFQSSEVSKIEWKTLDDCLNSIRPYNLEKKELIININKLIEEYRLYC
jgi:8-oxo-dGTP pyrophosphatase MutT (NUDIX family)